MRRLARSFVLIAAVLGGALDSSAQEEVSVPVPVTGRMLNLVLIDGERISGELIEADADRMLLWGASGMREIDYGQLTRLEARRHGFSSRTAFTWVGVGALVTAVGMTAACSQVEGTSCGGVFAGFTLSWAVIGGLFAGTVASGQYQDVIPGETTLRPLARFPQGAPPSFVQRNEAVARPPSR